eukprot:347836-Hanusia_phi.AAC.1
MGPFRGEMRGGVVLEREHELEDGKRRTMGKGEREERHIDCMITLSNFLELELLVRAHGHQIASAANSLPIARLRSLSCRVVLRRTSMRDGWGAERPEIALENCSCRVCGWISH